MSEQPAAGSYDFSGIEAKWQKYWLANKTFKTTDDTSKPKYYVLDMFPYPSGDGLHVGHPEGYTATDILARYKRMNGFNVLHPMGWDAFGLPAEQHAVRTGTHPSVTTQKNIVRFREQIRALGLSYDWDREINTTDPSYFKWTQWIFLQLYKKGLAYESHAAVNWCPALGTVLANEEVIDGRSEVGDHPVEKKPMRQWVLKITEYAERLLEDLEGLDWPESIKDQQRQWIGKSHGADLSFAVDGHSEVIKVFTTRPDTLYGATFMVLAPDHALVAKITTEKAQAAVKDYVEATAKKSERDRISSTKKTGVNTGAFAINPVNQERLPIFIADYVLASYGHGAIMAVPGHDERDHEFAKTYDLPIKEVVAGGSVDVSEAAHTGEGKLVHSDFLNGLNKEQAIAKMIDYLEQKKIGKGCITYKLRDWLFSRQRYWGEPFPLARSESGELIALDESELPVCLPELEDFKPTGDGEPPLARSKAWLEFKTPDGKTYQRETNTMPQWAGSCWYYLRFIDPLNDQKAWDADKEKYWMPVDLYIGGAEHAVLHLLYARFWHKVLYDLGHVSTKEPFQRLVNQGMILGENNEKMSKSRGNVVNPDDVIAEWGSDSMRLYEMFMGPLEAAKPWNTKGISGCFRFLNRFWRLLVTPDGSLQEKATLAKVEDQEFIKSYHRMVQKVTIDTEELRFNTAIAAMMEFLNLAYKQPGLSKDMSQGLVLCLAPYAPHMAEEIWQILGHKESLAYAKWPAFDPAMVEQEQIDIPVQVNGKLRGTLTTSKDADKDGILAQAKVLPSVQKHLEGKELRKEIFVPGKVINFVVS